MCHFPASFHSDLTDYVPLQKKLFFDSNKSSACGTIPVLQDGIPEESETLGIRVKRSDGLETNVPGVTGVIADADGKPVVTTRGYYSNKLFKTLPSLNSMDTKILMIVRDALANGLSSSKNEFFPLRCCVVRTTAWEKVCIEYRPFEFYPCKIASNYVPSLCIFISTQNNNSEFLSSGVNLTFYNNATNQLSSEFHVTELDNDTTVQICLQLITGRQPVERAVVVLLTSLNGSIGNEGRCDL